MSDDEIMTALHIKAIHLKAIHHYDAGHSVGYCKPCTGAGPMAMWPCKALLLDRWVNTGGDQPTPPDACTQEHRTPEDDQLADIADQAVTAALAHQACAGELAARVQVLEAVYTAAQAIEHAIAEDAILIKQPEGWVAHTSLLDALLAAGTVPKAPEQAEGAYPHPVQHARDLRVAVANIVSAARTARRTLGQWPGQALEAEGLYGIWEALAVADDALKDLELRLAPRMPPIVIHPDMQRSVAQARQAAAQVTPSPALEEEEKDKRIAKWDASLRPPGRTSRARQQAAN